MYLKDILHYYMGRTYSFSDGKGVVTVHTLVALQFAIDGGTTVKLHLRKLEDMTEEEAIDFVAISIPDGTYLSKNEYAVYYKRPSITSAGIYFLYGGLVQFHYLLSRGFDIFGLIESGQAIDIKTIQP